MSDAAIHRMILELPDDKYQASCACGSWRSHRYSDQESAEHQYENHVWYVTKSAEDRRSAIDRAEIALTPSDLATWSALYAAAWFHTPSTDWGHVTDTERATIAAHAADRALEALRAIRPEGE